MSVGDGLNNWLSVMAAAAGSLIAAFAGVAMRYSHAAQRGEKVDWSRAWLDAPTVFVMGIAGYAAHVYWGVPEVVGYVCASLLGYLGPRAVTLAIDYLQKKADGGGK